MSEVQTEITPPDVDEDEGGDEPYTGVFISTRGGSDSGGY